MTTRRHWVSGAVAAALLAGGGGWSPGEEQSSPGPAARMSGGVFETAPRPTRAWRSETYTTAAGENVRIEISDAYSADAVSGQAWAEFVGGLVHGRELATVTVRIAPPAEVAATCGDDALGCYGGGLLVIPGEQFGGVTPEEIARHEYGHHVAASRLNPPWSASAYGPKRWATAMRVCARAVEGTAFPSDDTHYTLSPGEAFAEAYRVLNDRRAGILGLSWSIVDDSFIPGDDVLRAVEQDVSAPWLGPTVSVLPGRFGAGTVRRRSYPVVVPLDGVVTATLRLPPGRTDTLELLDAGGRVVATGLWAGPTTRRLSYVACDQRRLVLRVTLEGSPGRFTVTLTRP